MRRPRAEVVALAVIALVLVVGLGYVHAKAPCGFYKFTPAKNIPARCLAHFEHR